MGQHNHSSTLNAGGGVMAKRQNRDSRRVQPTGSEASTIVTAARSHKES